MNRAIQSFEQIYRDNKNFTFDYANDQIRFDSEISKKENLKIGIFLFVFHIVMLLVAGVSQNVIMSWQFILFILAIGGSITAFCLKGRKHQVTIDFNKQTIINNKSTFNFADCEDIKLIKTRINFISVGYHIELVTKLGKTNFIFWYEPDINTAKQVYMWTTKYIDQDYSES